MPNKANDDKKRGAMEGARLLLIRFAAIISFTLFFGATLSARLQKNVRLTPARAVLHTQPHLIVVPVVVRDKWNYPVGGLRQRDFEIFSEGRRQIISLFAIDHTTDTLQNPIRGSKGRSGRTIVLNPRARYLALYFDDLHLNAMDAMRAADDSDYYLRTTAHPNMRVGIFTSSGSVTAPFTSNLQKLHTALMAISPHPPLAYENGGCPRISDLEAYLIAQAHDPVATELAIEAYYRCPAERGRRRSTAWRALHADRWRVERMATQLIPAYRAASRKTIANLGDLAQSMARLPGSHEIVVFSPGFLTIGLSGTLSSLFAQAVHSDTIISAIDTGGYTYAHPQGSDTQAPRAPKGFDTVNMLQDMQFERATEALQVLPELADNTGGTFVPSVSDLAYALRKADAVPHNRYILGFWVTSPHFDGRYHSISVRLLGHPHFTVQSRDGFTAPRGAFSWRRSQLVRLRHHRPNRRRPTRSLDPRR